MSESQEWLLIKKCKLGDVDAYTELVSRYQVVVYNCTLRILDNPADAADATQSSFLKLYEHIESFDSNRKFFSWMYRLAINEALDYKRKTRRFETIDGDQIECNSGNPAKSFEQDGTRSNIQAAIMNLGDDGRIVIALRHFSELSYQQISEILEIPEKTVRSRLYTARQQMRNFLLGLE